MQERDLLQRNRSHSRWLLSLVRLTGNRVHTRTTEQFSWKFGPEDSPSGCPSCRSRCCSYRPNPVKPLLHFRAAAHADPINIMCLVPPETALKRRPTPPPKRRPSLHKIARRLHDALPEVHVQPFPDVASGCTSMLARVLGSQTSGKLRMVQGAARPQIKCLREGISRDLCVSWDCQSTTKRVTRYQQEEAHLAQVTMWVVL